MPTSPYPDLRVYPTSGLTFPWAEMHPGGIVGSFDASLGPDGVGLTMHMLIRWADLSTALQELIGYSWVDSTASPPRLRRRLPWNHPYSNQCWVKNVSSVKGVQLRGAALYVAPGEISVGAGTTINVGPGSEFEYAQLVIHFWRPPYAILTDDRILSGTGQPQEWLRYLDRVWTVSNQILTRESLAFRWQQIPDTATYGKGLAAGSLGLKITKTRLTRRWYQIPEAALFPAVNDVTRTGLPRNLMYTQTATTNPITGYVYPAQSPLAYCVNSPIGGGPTDDDPTLRFLGCEIGTLLYLGADITPQPLQLPPALMQIPSVGLGGEPLSQIQYDVTLHFEHFDPPPGEGVPDSSRGHNLMPYAGNGAWYPVTTQEDGLGRAIAGGQQAGGTIIVVGPALTPYMYADFSDLFRILP